MVLTAAALSAAIVGWRRVSWGLLLVWLFAVVSTLSHVRMMGFCAVLSALVLTQGLSAYPALMRRWAAGVFRAMQPVALAGACLTALWVGWAVADSMQDGHYRRNDFNRSFGRLDANLWHPWRAAEFAAARGVKGHVFNNFEPGSFLEFALPRTTKVYIDTQFLYSRAFYLAYVELVKTPERLPGVLEAHDVSCVVFKHYAPNVTGLIRVLLANGAWTLVYLDECATVFLPAARGVQGVDLDRADPVSFLSRGKESDPRAYVTLAYFFGSVGRPTQAGGLYRAALGRDPGLYVAWNNLGEIYLEEGAYDQALACYVRCLRTGGDSDNARKRLRWILTGDLVAPRHPDLAEARELVE
jgi:tetratricopeptide (TPR) repeat protein